MGLTFISLLPLLVATLWALEDGDMTGLEAVAQETVLINGTKLTLNHWLRYFDKLMELTSCFQ